MNLVWIGDEAVVNLEAIDYVVFEAAECRVVFGDLCGPQTSFPRLRGKLIDTQAKDRAMRRRNPSVDLGPGFNGSEQLPYSP
jgi:hypothetical protein